jgi:hypothetical protein
MPLRCLAVASSVLIVLMAEAFPAAAQSSRPKPVERVARTPWGHPDLTGIWTNDTFTPLQRPVALAGKAFFTPEEVEQLNKALGADGVDPLAAGSVIAALASGKDSDALLQSQEDVHYDNSIWLTQSWRKGLSTLRTSLIFDPEDGRIPPLTPEAQKRETARAAALKGHLFDDPESRPMGERCIIWPHEGPPLLAAPYNNIIEIFQTPAYVVIVQEIIHNARIIPLDGRPHISPNVKQLSGDSRGHWEGDTLVVETTNYTGRTRFQNSTETLRVVESFTRKADGGIDYRFTVDDPNTWTRPWSAELPMMKVESRIFEYACHEGNHDLENILRVARTQEREASAAAKK